MKIIELENGKLGLKTPFNRDFINKVKQIGGKWDAGKQLWTVDARAIEQAREIMRDVYGQDDLPQRNVTIKIKVGDRDIIADRDAITIFGRTIASARGRDSGAIVGDRVTITNGSVYSGGSVKNWNTRISDNSEIIIYDVPVLAVEQKIGWDDDYGIFEVIENENNMTKCDIITLKVEKEKLLNRLAEIDKILNEFN